MKNPALFNLECNLILRLVAKKRILSPLNLRRLLKWTGPPGLPDMFHCHSQGSLRSQGFLSDGTGFGGMRSGRKTTQERRAASF